MAHPSGLSRAGAALAAAGFGSRPQALAPAAQMALLAALLGAAGVLAMRRLAGALVAPLPPGALLGAGAALTALAGAARGPVRREVPGQGRAGGRGRLADLLPSLAVLAAALALSVPGSGRLGLTGLWSLILAGEALAWNRARLPALRWRPARPRGAGGSGRVDPPQSPAPHVARSAAAAAGAPADDVVQQFTRRHLAGGAEELSGWLRVAFVAGQRTENVHVAFCPPFAAPPQLSAEQLAGPAARVKTAQLLPYGARLDLKLSDPAKEPTTVLLEFRARTAGGSA